MAGSRYWAESYVRLKDGRKIFLSTPYSKLKKSMTNNKKFISITESGLLFGKKSKLDKSEILEYGKYSLF